GGIAVDGEAEQPAALLVRHLQRPSTNLLDTLAAAAADGELQIPSAVELPLERAPDALVRSGTGGARGRTVFAL
ncbi:NADP-dependent oxidoreductase, partial [Streptomyces sp. NPDC051098]